MTVNFAFDYQTFQSRIQRCGIENPIGFIAVAARAFSAQATFLVRGVGNDTQVKRFLSNRYLSAFSVDGGRKNKLSPVLKALQWHDFGHKRQNVYHGNPRMHIITTLCIQKHKFF